MWKIIENNGKIKQLSGADLNFEPQDRARWQLFYFRPTFFHFSMGFSMQKLKIVEKSWTTFGRWVEIPEPGLSRAGLVRLSVYFFLLFYLIFNGKVEISWKKLNNFRARSWISKRRNVYAESCSTFGLLFSTFQLVFQWKSCKQLKKVEQLWGGVEENQGYSDFLRQSTVLTS